MRIDEMAGKPRGFGFVWKYPQIDGATSFPRTSQTFKFSVRPPARICHRRNWRRQFALLLLQPETPFAPVQEKADRG